MTDLEYQTEYIIDDTEIQNISELIIDALNFRQPDKYKNELTINNKEAILDSFAAILEKMLTLKMHLSREKKLEIINILNKLKAQREYMELAKENLVKGDKGFSDLLKASERLSKKAQSAFEGK